MIRIAISTAAGQRFIWIERVLGGQARRPARAGESYSDVILRLAEGVEQN